MRIITHLDNTRVLETMKGSILFSRGKPVAAHLEDACYIKAGQDFNQPAIRHFSQGQSMTTALTEGVFEAVVTKVLH